MSLDNTSALSAPPASSPALAAEPIRVLIVDDDEDDSHLIRSFLAESRSPRYDSERVETFEGGLEALRAEAFHVGILDYCLGAANGLELLRTVLAEHIDIPLIMLTGRPGRELDEQAMSAGAADFLAKQQLTPALLERTIRHAMLRADLMRTLREVEERFELSSRFSSAGFWEWSLGGNRIEVSRRWCELLGLPVEAIGEDPGAWFARVHPDDVEALKTGIAECLSGAVEEFRCDHRMLHASGGYRWVTTRGTARRNERGRIYRLAGVMCELASPRAAAADDGARPAPGGGARLGFDQLACVASHGLLEQAEAALQDMLQLDKNGLAAADHQKELLARLIDRSRRISGLARWLTYGFLS